MSRDERREKRRKRDEEWKQELARLQAKQAETSDRPSRERANRRNLEILAEVHRRMRGAEFRAWYEATTGMPVDDFIARVAITPEEYLRRPGADFSTQLAWTQECIKRVADSNPWTDPERRVHWAAAVANSKEAKERRSILIRLATPRWADRAKILEIYRERERMERETGIPHDVDHIIPIVHPDVCGLHCEHNLRVITAAENGAKSNSFNGKSCRATRRRLTNP